MPQDPQRTILVIANETIESGPLADALRWRAALTPVRVIVVCPATRQAHGFVVYEEAQLAAARVRLERMLPVLHELGFPVVGSVVAADPVDAARDAVALHRPDEILVSSTLKQYTESDPSFSFEPHGEYHFKGVLGEHDVYSVPWR